MRVIINPIGKPAPEDALSKAAISLNVLQTVWRFIMKEPIERRDFGELDLSTFSPQVAFDLLPDKPKKLHGQLNLHIGAFRGRVDTNGMLSLYSKEEGEAISSEYWRVSNCPPTSAWVITLANLALRHQLGADCDDCHCLGYHQILADELDRYLSKVELCVNCYEKLLKIEPYRADEIKQFADWLNRMWFKKFNVADLTGLSVPDLPVLDRQIRRQISKGRGEIFAPYRLVLILHYLPDLIPLLKGLMSLGAKESNIVLLIKPYPYGEKSLVGGHLMYHYPRLNIEYLTSLPPSPSQLEEALGDSHGNRLIVIEDGGYIVPYLHNKMENYASFCKGAVEQTTKGIRNDRSIGDLRIPVIDVAKSKFKDEHEAPLVGKSIVYNVQRILEKEGYHFPGKKAAVIGFGPIGQAVANGLRTTLNMVVYVADHANDARIRARNSGFYESDRAEDVIKDAFLVVGTTGGTKTDKGVSHTIARSELGHVAHGASLVSASSDQIEYDIAELKAMAHKTNRIPGVGTEYFIRRASRDDKLLLIGDGYPINFFRGTGIPNQSIDPILTQLLIGAVEVAANDLPLGIREGLADKLIIENSVLEDFLDVQS